MRFQKISSTGEPLPADATEWVAVSSMGSWSV